MINLFLPGFIFMSIFNWLDNRKDMNVSLFIIWCLFISYIIQITCSAVHTILFVNTDINEFIKILIYVLLGGILPFIIIRIRNIKCVSNLIYKTNNKSLNSDIFDDVIDYQSPTMLQIYLKSSDVYYIGKFCCREEKGLESWVVLINYIVAKQDTNQIVYDPQKDKLKSTVMINLRDVDRIELVYNNDSKVWKKMTGGFI